MVRLESLSPNFTESHSGVVSIAHRLEGLVKTLGLAMKLEFGRPCIKE